MKRLTLFVLTLILLFSLTSCSEKVSDKEAEKAVEAVLGNIEELPMDIAPIKDKLGENAFFEDSGEDGRGDSTQIAIGNGVAVFRTVTARETSLESGLEYKFVITVVHFGSAEKKADNTYNMHFIGANISVEMESEDLDAVKQEMLGKLGEFGDDAALMEELINGKQIYVDNSSRIWEMYAEADKDIEAKYNSDTNTFLIMRDYGYDEMLDQYSYSFLDLRGREYLTEYYRIDSDGKKWITEHYEYDYLADGSVHVNEATYHHFTDHLKSEQEYFELPDTSWRIVWRKAYYEDGTLEFESYTDDEGRFVEIGYTTCGDKQLPADKRIYENYRGYETGRPIYWEELSYYDNGTICTKKVDDSSFILEEIYYQNGKPQLLIKKSKKYETIRYVYENSYFESGNPKLLKTFHESGVLRTWYEYEEFEGKTRIVRLTDYYDSAEPRQQKCVYPTVTYTYYPNGENQSETRYFDEENTRIREYAEYYENGEEKYRYTNNEQGEKEYVCEHYDNGSMKYLYMVLDDGTIDETEFYIGNPDDTRDYPKSNRILYPDGSETKWEFDENAEWETCYSYNASTKETEEEFYELVGNSYHLTEYRLTEADGAYTVWKYFADGTSYCYYKDADGNITETYYDTNGKPKK